MYTIVIIKSFNTFPLTLCSVLISLAKNSGGVPPWVPKGGDTPPGHEGKAVRGGQVAQVST